MPELPELEGLVAWIRSDLAGHTIEDVRLRSVAALKTYDPPLSALIGQTVAGAARTGKYLSVTAGNLILVTHLSLGGWMRWVDNPNQRKPSLRGPIIAEIRFGTGSLDLTEHGKEKRLAIWLVRDLEDVPQIPELGPDALSPELDLATFSRVVLGHKGTIKSVLANQHVIAGIGNAYSDEILHEARLSPLLRTSKITEPEVDRLYGSMRKVLSEAVVAAAGKRPGNLKDGKRSRFQVHARAGETCPTCGDTIRAVWMGSRSFQYCPTCQSGGRVYKDRRMSRLLK
ncbi:MAG TPA: DNA-formamidopyrimidine glycosylase family protein [Chloroflexota bacterium]|jgi:formamidopyrimidine-DNA glycosylase|nr:DNA-formamidopyrimidine glycosylase family protein [Chloroflexota bacterium]